MVSNRSLSVVVAALAVFALLAAGCGSDDGSDNASPGEDATSADVVSAVLGIITTNIETDSGDGFAEATEGESLVVGDQVKTDATGFAEVTYHDGSWMRVESEATLMIDDLADTDDGQVVSTSIDTGEAWNRVRELSEPEDEFVVDTPVASAAVRGTAFSIDCDGDTSCTFSVLEGEVLITPDVGDPVTLTAGQSLTVTTGEEPPAPEEPGVEALSAEPFIAKNLQLDREQDPALGPELPEEGALPPESSEPPAPPADEAACTISGTAGDRTLEGEPVEDVEQGFILSFGEPYMELSFGTGEGGAGRPYLQVSSDSGVWIGDASVTPGVGASAQGSLKADSGGAPLAVSLEVTCGG